ncbi:unnamed protein product [Protopolystoma xenopodis]|uniref:Uncharacterized protein n=1 Tax=Protopolystoma xenopodis TaxID=117903 RepID=A0A448WBP2_9PLAT|nr:unnamed protein product [Protopolystoma xenopodis]
MSGQVLVVAPHFLNQQGVPVNTSAVVGSYRHVRDRPSSELPTRLGRRLGRGDESAPAAAKMTALTIRLSSGLRAMTGMIELSANRVEMSLEWKTVLHGRKAA